MSSFSEEIICNCQNRFVIKKLPLSDNAYLTVFIPSPGRIFTFFCQWLCQNICHHLIRGDIFQFDCSARTNWQRMSQPTQQAFLLSFGAKRERGSGFLVLTAGEMKREPKNERPGRERGRKKGRKRLQTNPSILKICVRQRTQRLIGSASRTILTCVDQRFVSH